MKSNSDNKPLVFQNLGNGTWHYNYNVEEVEMEGRNAYNYNTVQFFGKPCYDKIVSLIIRENYTLDEELSIQRQRDTKPEIFEEYNQFCDDTKKMVKQDIENITE